MERRHRSLTSVATGFTATPEMVLSLRALLGIARVFVPAALAPIASVIQKRRVPKRLQSGHRTAGRVVMGGWYGGFVAERLDWRWVFWLVGAFGVAYGFFLGPVIRRLLPSEKNVSSQNPRSVGSANPLNLFRTPTFCLFAVAFFIFCAMLWVIYAWLPTFFVEKFAYSLTSAGLTATLSVQLTTALGLLAGGFAADKLIGRFKEARIWILILGMLGTAPCLYLLANAPTAGATQVAAAAFGLFNGFYVSNAMASALDVVHRSRHATAIGVMNMVGGFSGGLSAYMIGRLKNDYGMESMMSWVGATGVVAVALFVAVLSSFRVDYPNAGGGFLVVIPQWRRRTQEGRCNRIPLGKPST
jgi:MFS family permease